MACYQSSDQYQSVVYHSKLLESVDEEGASPVEGVVMQTTAYRSYPIHAQWVTNQATEQAMGERQRGRLAKNCVVTLAV